MTLTSELNRVQYSGDAATVAFAVTYVFWSLDDVRVIHTDAAGVETTWVRGTQYTVTGGDGATGTVTVETSPTDYTPASGTILTLTSNLDDTQNTALPAGGPFPSTAVEKQFDQIVRIIQQVATRVGRGFKFKDTSAETEATIDDLTGNAAKFGRVNAGETGIEWTTLADLGALTVPVGVSDGGTGATTAAAARTALGLAIGSAVQAYNALTSFLNVKQAWTKDQYYTPQSDTQAAAVLTIDFDDGAYTEVTLTQAVTTMTLNNMEPGGTYDIRITGAFTITGWAADDINDFTWTNDTEHVFGAKEYTLVTIKAGNTTNLITATDFGA
jgi:hypothetical protein